MPTALTVRTEAGIFWHSLAEELRRQDLDYLSAPLNLTSSVGGTLGVGGIDVNSARLGCSADQALALQVVTPTGEIVECSDTHNAELFQRVILGYGQFGVITEATLRVRRYTPLRMHYFYYASLRTAIEDLQLLDRNDASDYSGILTIMDCAVNVLVAFDSTSAKRRSWRTGGRACAATASSASACARSVHYALRPWKLGEAWYLLQRKRELFPELRRPEYMRDGTMLDRSVVFSRAVWKFWGSRQMVIPDLATSADQVRRGGGARQRGLPQVFPALHALPASASSCAPEHRARITKMSCIPPDAEGWAYGCEFEPMLDDEGLQPRSPAVVQERDLRHRRGHGRQLLSFRRHDERLYPPRVRRRPGGPAPGDEAQGRPGDDPQPRRDFLECPAWPVIRGRRLTILPPAAAAICACWCARCGGHATSRLTPLKARQGAASSAQAPPTCRIDRSCTLCAACEPVCPEDIPWSR